MRLVFAQGGKELNAVHARHLDVQQDRGVVGMLCQVKAFVGVAAFADVEPLPGEDTTATLTNCILIIHNQESRFV